MKKIKILSIDGGGIRGIIPGTILAELEEILQKQSNSDRKIGDYFDMIAGTSTGGILSCIYLMPDNDGKAKYSAKEALDLYIKNGHTIFDRTLAQKIESIGGILHEKYSEDPLYQLLKSYFGDVTLDRLIRPSLITSYEITDRRAIFFTSADARKDNICNFYVRDVARATSAAPTYFAPAHIKSLNGQLFALVDGGVFANNPAMCAYAEARKLEFSKFFNDQQKRDKPTAEEMIILSLGTGSVKKRYRYDDFKNAGEIKWLEPVIDILMSGNSETVAYQLMQMYRRHNEQDQAFNSIKEEGSGWETARTIIETGGVSFETTEQGLIGAQRLANRIGGTSSQILRGGAATEFTGYGLTALSAASTIMNAETKYGHLRTSDKVDLAIDAATTVTEISLSALEVTTPVGWIIGGSLFVGNLISEHYNHESLTEWLFN